MLAVAEVNVVVAVVVDCVVVVAVGCPMSLVFCYLSPMCLCGVIAAGAVAASVVVGCRRCNGVQSKAWSWMSSACSIVTLMTSRGYWI